MTNFQWPEPALLQDWSNELIDGWGNRVAQWNRRIVFFKGKHWFVKFKPNPEELKTDYLAYLLSRNWANIAEVLPLTVEEFNSIVSLGVPVPKYASIHNTFLVRMAQDYDIDELPNGDTDTATAAELVFSIWTRRRDAHPANRVYNKGVPIFFDHQTAFLGEPHLRNPYVFFLSRIDAGHAGRWRLRKLENNSDVVTAKARQTSMKEDLALHFVKNYEKFDESVLLFGNKLKGHSLAQWHQDTLKAGFDQSKANKITEFLSTNLESLDSTIEIMRSILLSAPISLRYWKLY